MHGIEKYVPTVQFRWINSWQCHNMSAYGLTDLKNHGLHVHEMNMNVAVVLMYQISQVAAYDTSIMELRFQYRFQLYNYWSNVCKYLPNTGGRMLVTLCIFKCNR